MSRYKKVLLNEIEMPEIDDIIPVPYLTIETRLEALELLQVQAKQGMDIRKVKDYLVKVLKEGCFEHDEKGLRLELKETEKDFDITLLDAYVTKNLMDLWMTLLEKGQFISKQRAEELQKQKLELKNSAAEN
jgi:hypothetical protein